MQVVARLMNRALLRKGAYATVIGATSGDTGAAAIEAFRGLEAIDIFILHPKGRISDVQRRQMTTAAEENVHNIAVEGTFDDCQTIVKGLFGDLALRDRLELTGINSINFARILAQIAYYFTAAVSARRALPARSPSPCPPEISVIFSRVTPPARWALPVARLVIATNLNDSLPRALSSGIYEPRGVVATSSPSMDIQLASNFERHSVRACRPRPCAGEVADGGVAQDGGLPPERYRAFGFARAVQRACDRRARDGDDHSLPGGGDRHACRSAHRRRAARRRAPRAGLGRRPWSCCRRPIPPNSPKRSSGPAAACRSSPSACGLRLGQHERCTMLPNDYAAVASFIETNARAGRQARSQAASAGQRCARERRAVRACQRPHRGQPFHGRGRDRVARHLGRRGQPQRDGKRARRRPFPRAHGLQGHGAAQRQGYRRGDRGGRWRAQRRDRRRTRPPITRACCARTWRSRSTS